jgi:16S rRNA (guanine527-N7)-methyltransferase
MILSMNKLPEMLEIWQASLNWSPSNLQQTQLQQVYDVIITANQQLNLTRITEVNEFWEKHIWDSLRGVLPLFIPTQKKDHIIDIGTGAGFPGIPVAIAFPDSHITLVDSTQKKIKFVQSLISEIGLEKAEAISDRAESLGHNRAYRDKYNVALIRAVASASVCAEYSLPLLEIGGLAILYRGQWLDQETEELETAIKQLGAEIEGIDRFKTPLSDSVRTCIWLRKIAPTKAGFPRAIGVPTQKPL